MLIDQKKKNITNVYKFYETELWILGICRDGMFFQFGDL